MLVGGSFFFSDLKFNHVKKMAYKLLGAYLYVLCLTEYNQASGWVVVCREGGKVSLYYYIWDYVW